MWLFSRGRLLLPFALLMLIACQDRLQSHSSPTPDEVYTDYWQAHLELDALNATEIGDNRFDHLYPNDISEGYRERRRSLEKTALDQASGLDMASLSGRDRWILESFMHQRRTVLERLKYPDHLLPLNQFFNRPVIFANMGAGNGIHPFKSVQDYENFLARMDGFIVWIDQAIANMRDGVQQGVVQPVVVIAHIERQLSEYIGKTPQETSFWKPLENMPADFSEAERNRLMRAYEKKLSVALLPAYARLHSFVRDEYLPAGRNTAGYGALPNGAAWYQSTILEMTGRAMSAETIHEIGLREVARLQAEIRGVMATVGFDGTLVEFFRHMNESPEFQPHSAQQLISRARELKESIDARAREYFELLPQQGYVIEEMDPVIGSRWSGAYYQVGAPDGSRPGLIAVNTTNLPARLIWILPAMALHEGAPGHHYQMTLQQELDLPEVQKHAVNMAFVEGWGTYAETLGAEMGAYEDPYSHFGVLNLQLWRAVRLVVDTGLHAKGWTREQAMQYLVDNLAPSEGLLVPEVERYMVWPGQALSYMIGAMTFRELRAEAASALGTKFDVREYHRIVLEDGALPLGVLEAKVREWIERKRDPLVNDIINDRRKT